MIESSVILFFSVMSVLVILFCSFLHVRDYSLPVLFFFFVLFVIKFLPPFSFS